MSVFIGLIIICAGVGLYTLGVSSGKSHLVTDNNYQAPQNRQLKPILSTRNNVNTENEALNKLALSIDELAGRISRLESQDTSAEEIDSLYDAKLPRAIDDPLIRETRRIERLNQSFDQAISDDRQDILSKDQVDALFLNSEQLTYNAVEITSSECKSGQCKVQISIKNDEEFEDFEDIFISDVSSLGYNRLQSYVSKDGDRTVVTYFTSSVSPPPEGADPRQRPNF